MTLYHTSEEYRTPVTIDIKYIFESKQNKSVRETTESSREEIERLRNEILGLNPRLRNKKIRTDLENSVSKSDDEIFF